MDDIIIIAILLLVIGGAAFYVYKAKKSGKKCIGCPDSESCSGSCGGCNSNTENCCQCGCGGTDAKDSKN